MPREPSLPPPIYDPHLVAKAIVFAAEHGRKRGQRDTRLVEHLYPPGEAQITPVRQERIPTEAPDWYFEEELRRSGLWEMMERCYPSTQSQSQ